MQIALAIMQIYPDIQPIENFIVRDDSDGRGQYIDLWAFTEPQPTQEQLQSAWLEVVRTTKLSELNNSCESAIIGGFVGANGHTYQFDYKDQDNLTQQMLFLVSDQTLTSVLWKTEDKGIISHTRSEFLQVCTDANNWKRSQMGKYWQLEAQVKGSTTEETINSIVW
jgi:hypothetical protein